MDIKEIRKKIAPILKDYGVNYAGLFGSTAREEDTSESDVDILVSTKNPISVYQFVALKYKLEEMLGKEVDLVSKNAVNKYVKPYIEKDIIDIYEGQ